MSDAVKTAIFEALTNSACSPNARLVIKIEIVNPMPPSMPAPIRWRQRTSVGSVQMPIVTAMADTSATPRGFPITRPRITPKLFGPVTSSAQFVPKTIPVLASANYIFCSNKKARLNSRAFLSSHFSNYLQAALASSNKRLPSNPLPVTSLTHSSATPAVAASQRFISAAGKV